MRRNSFLLDTAGLKELLQTGDISKAFLKAGRIRQ